MNDPAPRAKPHTQRFRRTQSGPVLTDAQKRRQATVTEATWLTFGDSARTAEFLNTHDEQLSGRPLDLAVEGEEGLNAVLQRLKTPPYANPAS